MLFLGSGNGFAPGRAYSSFLLDRRILFEATPTTLPALKKQRIPLHRIEYLFISHLHGDHCFGLPFIFLDHYFVSPRKKTLVIIGPQGVRSLAHRLIDLAFAGTRKRYGGKLPLRFLEVRPGREYTVPDIVFRVFPMHHGGLEALGFLLIYRGKRLAYSGDTGPCPGLKALLEQPDVAVLEMSSLKDDFDSHLNRRDILRLRKGLPPSCRVILTHLPSLSPAVEQRLRNHPCGPLEFAADGGLFRV